MKLLRFLGFDGMANKVQAAGQAMGASLMAPFGDARAWSREQWSGFWGDWRAQAIPQVQGAQMLSVLPASFFSTPDFGMFATELKGVQEVIRWTWYSYRAYPTTGVSSLLLFSQSEGEATNGRLDTNMTDVSKLPGNEMGVIVGLGIDPIPAAADVFVTNGPALALQEWWDVLQTGVAVLKISGKEYQVIAPLTKLPPGYGLGLFHTSSAAAATTINVSNIQSGSPDNRSRYNLDPPLGILPTRPFELRLSWNSLQTVTTAGRLGANMDGWKIRAAL